jgi:hypothetical protein
MRKCEGLPICNEEKRKTSNEINNLNYRLNEQYRRFDQKRLSLVMIIEITTKRFSSFCRKFSIVLKINNLPL